MSDTKMDDMTQLFDGFDPSAHEREVEARWGRSDAYRESQRRTRGYGPEEWTRYHGENTALMRSFAEAMNAGAAAEDPQVRALVEAHRLLIDRWFYPCDEAMHAALADMYEADPRFCESIDGHGVGLTRYLVAAIRRGEA